MNLNALSIITWNVDPDIFIIPFLNHPVRWYGVAWAIGLFLSQQIMTLIYKKEGRPDREIDIMTLYLVAGTLIGARLGHVLFYDPVEYFQNPITILFIWEGGLASHGGTIGVLMSSWLFVRRTHVSYLWFLDRLAIAGALIGGFIRLGNLMNSEMIGIPGNIPWAFVFTRIDDIPRHPAQLYEALYCFVIFALCFFIWHTRRYALRDGQLAGLFLVVLFSLRFVDELFKENQVAFEDGLLLNMGQILSIPFVLIGLVILIITYLRPRKKLADNSVL